MADRYWVGGSGTWNTTSTTNWSASSGGAGGASVPTAADSVFFDQAGTYTVTCTGALTCLDITVSAGTVTFANGTSPTFTISGSMSLVAGTVWSSTGAVTFNATTTGKTITTNGTTLSGGATFSGVGGYWTLGSSLTTTSTTTVTVSNGTFDTAGYAVTTQSLVSNAATARTINLNNSTVTLLGVVTVNFSNTTNLTFNAGTSSIVCSASGAGLTVSATSGVTFYDVAFTSTSLGTTAITGANTFNNLAVTAPSTAGVTTVTFAANQTINGTLSTTGTAGNCRVFFASDTYGIGRTLTVNSAPSLTDADFRDIYVKGTAAPISGTRIGNRGNCTGITFSTPKTVYFATAAGGTFGGNNWATSPGGAVSLDNIPLPQDTAAFVNTGLNTSTTITFDATSPYLPTIDASARTTALTFSGSTAYTIYGSYILSTAVGHFRSGILTFSGEGTKTITSAGNTFFSNTVINAYGGTIQLGDAYLSGVGAAISVQIGSFVTNNYTITADSLSSLVSTPCTISLGSSTVNLISASSAAVNFNTSGVFTFNAGTSQINLTAATPTFTSGLKTFYNVSATTALSTLVMDGGTYNNLTLTPPAAAGFANVTFGANATINGTLTCAGASAIRRIFLQSDTLGTQRTLTVNSLSANDCDFRDIAITGTASGTSPTRAGNCGNNSGITFPAPKTVYWNLAGSQNWSATGWATSSGGTPAVNNFPLAQDTAIIDDTGAAGTITINAAWNIGTFDASGRTSAMTFNIANIDLPVYGDWKFGTGVTPSSIVGGTTFFKKGTQTITSNGVQFQWTVTVNNPSGYVQLADAFSAIVGRGITITSGTFDAVTYNVTIGVLTNSAGTSILKMGSGTWTLTGTATVWNCATAPIMYAGTSTIVLSDTSTSARTFAGGSLYYNKLTIGGTTGTSTLTITGNNTFGELASTKTVAHTIALGGTITNFGKWSVTGTAGNVVTITGSSTTNNIYGPAVTGIDYLAMGTWGFGTTSFGEFYAGANSTGTAAAPVYRTAAPAPRTLYWVGGTGNWSSTTKWSTSSGGASGAAIPTSLDSVVFDSASNATAYTATIDAGVPIARCAAFTMAGPASGNVTFTGTVSIAHHGNVSFAATGITRTYTGNIWLVGNSSYTFTTNGLSLANSTTVVGIGSTWTLGSALNISSSILTVTCGAFTTNNYNYTGGTLVTSVTNVVSLSLGSSSLSVSGSVVNFTGSSTTATPSNLTFDAGTSTITQAGGAAVTMYGGSKTFYNFNLNYAANSATHTIYGANTFNNFSAPRLFSAGIVSVLFADNQTINGTLTRGAGGGAYARTFLASNTIGTTRTLTVNSLAAGAADIDFRDITIAGAAAPISGTRFGDCKGNSGITFPAAKTVYYGQTGSASWGVAGSGSWSATSGGALDATMFPLAQDTAVFPAATYPASGATTTIDANYNIGTIDMSLRTSNTMTLATGSTTPAIYGNWINGTGTTLTGVSGVTFAGRGSQTITSAGKTFTQLLTVNTPSGSVILQDSAVVQYVNHAFGTLDLNGYTLSTTATGSNGYASNYTTERTFAFGSGGVFILIASSSLAFVVLSTGYTVTGSGTISMPSISAKTFGGGGANYSGVTLNQGGAGTLSITGNNTFANITNTYSATGATTINLAATTQRVGAFTAAGTSTRLLTITGTSAASPATLIYTGAGVISDTNYVVPTFVRAYPTTTTWYAGANSTNGGTLGWIFSAYSPTPVTVINGQFFNFF